MTTRPATATDTAAIRMILHTIELFPPEMLDEMMADYLKNPDSGHHWLVAEVNGEVTGFCYAVPEELTDRTYNLLAIGVRADQQGKGIGQQLIQAAEDQLRSVEQRIIIVDTSGSADFALTRKFYLGLGYTKAAVIPDYWADGDDKVVFWKRLG